MTASVLPHHHARWAALRACKALAVVFGLLGEHIAAQPSPTALADMPPEPEKLAAPRRRRREQPQAA